ncbi:MAG: hypothetical protein EON58_05670 [Alphaproteobacteria bacterium]|nr:MAG: hypothetical protein EON58_05670 [Alphaproteobacteria bacterium]
MSLTKRDRKFRSGSGKSFPPGNSPSDGAVSFAEAIALALKGDFGDGPTAVRKVARLLQVNDRAVKNWFSAKNAPNGELLVRLICHSDGVLETVLSLATRDDVLRAKQISDAQRDFWKVLDRLHRLMRPLQS